jgi:DNA-binding beta-propeller fold protein YncE
MHRQLVLSAALVAAAARLAAAQDSLQHLRVTKEPVPRYHLAGQYPLGGEGGWDYLTVDTARHRVFVTRSDRVMVVDQSSGRLLGEIPGLHRGHGVALAYPANRAFVTSGADSTVTMFDLATLRVLGRTAVDVDDDAVLYDPASKRVFTFNGDAATASALDASSGQRVGTIPLGGKPEAGVTAGDGTLFVNIEDKAEIVEIDSRALSVRRRWSIAPCQDPTGLAIDVAHHRLFSACRNQLMAISDASVGRLLTTLPIGRGTDGAAFDAATSDAFSTNGEGTVTVIHEDSPDLFRVADTVKTMPGARTIALDPTTHRVYTASARLGPAPAEATPENPRRRPPVIPGTFTVLVIER